MTVPESVVSGVCYPYVIDRRKRLLRAAGLGGVSGCFCLGCGREVGWLDGRVLGHESDGAVCRPEQALCQAARLAVREGFVGACEGGGEYYLESSCGDCGVAINRVGLVGAGADLREGERGELLFSTGRLTAVVEVYTGRYGGSQSAMFVDEAAVPVYRVEVRDFRCVEELRAGVVAGGGLCLEAFCVECGRSRRVRADQRLEGMRTREAERQRSLADRDRRIRESARVKVREIVREESVGLMFVPWYRTRGGQFLEPQTQRPVFANGVLLTECGFEQHSVEKPWLFRKFLGNGVCAYADLGGPGSPREEYDPRVGVYVMGMETEEGELRDLIRGEVERRLGIAGVDLPDRAGFAVGGAVDAVGAGRVAELVELEPEVREPLAGTSVDSISRWRGTQSPARGR